MVSKKKKIVSGIVLVVSIVLLLFLLRSCSRSNSSGLIDSVKKSTSPWINKKSRDSRTKKAEREAKKTKDSSNLESGNANTGGNWTREKTDGNQLKDDSSNKHEPSKKQNSSNDKKTPDKDGSGGKTPAKPEEPVYQFEIEFKENYLAWSNLQAQALIDHPEYVEDMVEISKKFSEISVNAQKKRYKEVLTDEDKKIYSFYGAYAKEIEALSTLVSKKKFDEAESFYRKMLDKETTIK